MTPRYVWATLVVAAFIVYGSLVPFHWYAGASDTPLRYVLGRWNTPRQPWFGLIGNILLYLPLGLFASLARARRAGMGGRLLVAGLISAALCLTVEVIQVYDWGRQATLTDTYYNVAGALLGAALACRLPRRIQRPSGDMGQPFVLGLLALFFLMTLYPFAPSLHGSAYIAALSHFWAPNDLTLRALISHALVWLLAAALCIRLFGERDGALAWGLLAGGVFIGQVVIPAHPLRLAEWASVAGVALVVLGVTRLRRIYGGRLLLAVLVLGQAWLIWTGPNSTSLVPFDDLGHGSWRETMLAVGSAFYLVGGTVWVLVEIGVRGWRAGLAVGGLFAGLALASLMLDTGRASTTPAVLALIAGLLLSALSPRYSADSSEGIGA